MIADPAIISFRPDAETHVAPHELMRASHTDRSTVIRRAIALAAHEVAASDSDRAELSTVRAELADLCPW
ncbi:hypothetical protein [Crossiella cryophila]|uniref:Uncharacterized protein n=1 Tax=Crossiella cryophila TaxID=43355 RepID=A0A7W7CJP0_9PSEU|nr:hypothetical protein [Crossiella cryophila]MBB4682395.1 hypothetical protein [Crossiella cryophila]